MAARALKALDLLDCMQRELLREFIGDQAWESSQFRAQRNRPRQIAILWRRPGLQVSPAYVRKAYR